MEILSETPSLKLSPGTNTSSEHIHLNMTWVKEDTHDNGSKITADGDCSHEIKRHLVLERKVMTNLDSILKSRDITLPGLPWWLRW